MLEVGFHSWSFASLPLETALRRIKDVGFTEVEIEADKIHLDPRVFLRSELPPLRNLLVDLSLHPNSVHAPMNGADLASAHPEGRRQTIKLLADTLEYCRAIECQMMVVHPNRSESLPVGREAMKKNAIAALKELISKAEDLGVKIALENMIEEADGRFGSRVVDLRKIIESVQSSSIGICFDTGHTNLLRGRLVTQEMEIAQAGEYLWTLHVHDNDGKEDRHWPPGEGNVNWRETIESLRKVKYRGVFTMEIQERGNPDELARRSLQRAINILSIR